MSWIVIDVEADNKSPVNGSIVCFGAVLVKDVNKTFYGQIKPITDIYNEESLSISGFSREQHRQFDDPYEVMLAFHNWVSAVSEPPHIFATDNPAFDWQWINYYFHKYLDTNIFGYSARRIGDLYCGMKKDTRSKWKHLRITPATHHPVDDAKGNAEIILLMKEQGLKIKL